MPDQGDLAPAFGKLRDAATGLPDTTEDTWYGTPALKVGGKGFCRVKDAQTVVLMCELAEKEMLLAAAPELYFETLHYAGWPWILVRIATIDPAELRHRLVRAWALRAPKKLAQAFRGGDGSKEQL